jgi:hypothetical protein
MNNHYFKYHVGENVGLINQRGEFITPPLYSDITGISPTLFAATLQDGQSIVIIDQDGNVTREIISKSSK